MICACARVVDVRRDEQLVEALIAIADRAAVDFEHVAKLHPPLVAGEFHQQHVRAQLPALRG